MLRRCLSPASVVLLLALGGLNSGCHQDNGPSPDAQVETLRLNAELDRMKKKLAAAERDSAAKDDVVILAHEEAEKLKKDVAQREGVVTARETRIHALEGEIAQMKKQDAFVFAEISKLHQQGLNSTALDRYRQFVTNFPKSPLVADANRAIAELNVTAPREARARATAGVDPYAAEREILKKWSDGWATAEEVAPLLKKKSMADVIKLLGQPNTTYREGTELGYVDKVVDAGTGARGTLVIGFEGDKVATLRVGYQGRPIRP